MTKLVEHVVETLPKVDSKLSYFVDVDGTRLLLKVFDRGRGPTTSLLRATALPFGRYDVVGSNIVHRFDPTTTLRELTLHQQQLRGQTPDFRTAVKALAAKVGGRVGSLDADPITEGGAKGDVGYTIKVKRGANVDVAKLQTRASVDAAVVFATDVHYGETNHVSELGVMCADRVVDALARWYGPSRWAFFDLLEEHCGIAAILSLQSRVLELQLAREPKNAAAVARALHDEFADAGEGTRTVAEWKKSLASRELHMFWDY